MSNPLLPERKPLLYKQLAAMVATGATRQQMAIGLGVSPNQITGLLRAPELKDEIAKLGDEITKVAANEIRKGCGALTGEALRALQHNLRQNSMEAVKTVFRALGVEQAGPGETQDRVVNIILPGAAPAEKPVEGTVVVLPSEQEPDTEVAGPT